jgi:ribosomal protein S2
MCIVCAFQAPDLIVMIGIPVLPVVMKEAAQLMIPTIGVVDTNCDGSLLSIPIPGNDDSLEAVKLYLRLFAGEIIAEKRVMFEDQRRRAGGRSTIEGGGLQGADGLNFASSE